jgi:spore germination protein GerM
MTKITTTLLSIAIAVTAFLPSIAQTPTTTIKVYFHNERLNPNQEDCRKVFPTDRKVPKTKSVATAALLELFKGVTDEEKAAQFWSWPAEHTRGILKSVNVKNGAAYVNFTKAMYPQMGNATSSCGGGFFPSVEKTLKQFPTIKKVFYAIDGSPKEFYEWAQVGDCPRELKNCDARNFR